MADKPTDGGPAFPEFRRVWEQDENQYVHYAEFGMTLRDYFAGQALEAYMTSNVAMTQLAEAVADAEERGEDRRRATAFVLASRAYATADAMIAERERWDDEETKA